MSRTNGEIIMGILEQEAKNEFGRYSFYWSKLAERAHLTTRETIATVNELEKQGVVKFRGAIGKRDDCSGDYLVCYE